MESVGGECMGLYIYWIKLASCSREMQDNNGLIYVARVSHTYQSVNAVPIVWHLNWYLSLWSYHWHISIYEFVWITRVKEKKEGSFW